MAAAKISLEVTKKELEDICEALTDVLDESEYNPEAQEKEVKRVKRLLKRIVKLHSDV